MSPFRGTAAIALIPLLLVAAAVAVPLLARDHLLLAYALRRFFALVCHQDPERSFRIAGAPVAICVRCLGIYLGTALGSASLRLAGAASRPRLLTILFITFAANALDVVAETAGLHGNLPLPRFFLGVAAGIALGALLRASLPLTPDSPCPTALLPTDPASSFSR